MFTDIKLRSEVDVKYFGERVKIEKELGNSEGRYVYQVSHKGVPYILKGFRIQLEHLNPEDKTSVVFFKASLMQISEVFQEYYFGKAAEPFNPHIAAPLALDFMIDVARNKASSSFMWIEIIFEYGGEALNTLKSITLELTYNLMRQSANALSMLHNLGIAHFDIKPGNMVYDAGKDLLKIIDMGSAFGSFNKKKLAATTVKIEGKVRSGTLEFAPPEVLLMGESIADNPNLGLSLASIDVYCWAMSFFAIVTERKNVEMNSYYTRYRSRSEADYKKFMEIVKTCFDCVMTKDSKEEELKEVINSLLINALQYNPKERPKMKDIIDKMKLFEKEKNYTLNYSKTELKQNRNILKILTDSDDVDNYLNELNPNPNPIVKDEKPQEMPNIAVSEKLKPLDKFEEEKKPEVRTKVPAKKVDEEKPQSLPEVTTNDKVMHKSEFNPEEKPKVDREVKKMPVDGVDLEKSKAEEDKEITSNPGNSVRSPFGDLALNPSFTSDGADFGGSFKIIPSSSGSDISAAALETALLPSIKRVTSLIDNSIFNGFKVINPDTNKAVWTKTHFIFGLDCSDRMAGVRWDCVTLGYDACVQKLKAFKDILVSAFTFDCKVNPFVREKTPASAAVNAKDIPYTGKGRNFKRAMDYVIRLIERSVHKEYLICLLFLASGKTGPGGSPKEQITKLNTQRKSGTKLVVYTFGCETKEEAEIKDIADRLEGEHYSLIKAEASRVALYNVLGL